MASYNGISIKGLKKFRGHDGENLLQGTLYIGNRKLGYWSEDAWGGPDIISIGPAYNQRKLEELLLARGADLDSLGFEILKLIDDEKLWKKFRKQGSERLFIAEDDVKMFTMKNVKESDTVEKILERADVQMFIDKYLSANKEEHRFRIVDENSFDVGDPISVEDIIREL